MNVALTRAKRKLLVIGDSATLGGEVFYQRLLAHIECCGGYRTVWRKARDRNGVGDRLSVAVECNTWIMPIVMAGYLPNPKPATNPQSQRLNLCFPIYPPSNPESPPANQ